MWKFVSEFSSPTEERCYCEIELKCLQMKLLPLTDVLLDAQLQLLALHLLDLLVVELVPVAGAGVLHVGDVVA